MSKHDEQYYRTLLEELDTAVAEHRLIYDESGQAIDYEFLYVNDAFCRTLKLLKEEVIGSRVTELIRPLEYAWIERYAKVVNEQTSERFVMYNETLETYFNVFAYSSGKDTFVATFSNVGKISPTIEENYSKQKNTVAFLEYNRITQHVLSINNVKELIGQEIKTFEDFDIFIKENTHPDDVHKVVNLTREIRQLKEAQKLITLRVYHNIQKAYVRVDFTVFVKRYSGEIPEIITIFGQNKDNEFKQLELKSNTERLFNQTKKVANIATFLYDVPSSTFEPSIEMAQFLGLESLSTIEEYRSVVHPDDLEAFDQATEDIVSRPDGRVNQYRISKYGEIHHLESFLYGHQDDLGNTVKVFGIVIDRTSDVNQRKIIENARSAFERVFNLSPSGIFAVDSDFEITLKNDKFKAYLEANQLYNTLQDLLDEKSKECIETLQSGSPIENVQIMIKDGQYSSFYHVSITPIEGNFRNKYLGTVVDITDLVFSTKEIEYLSTHDMLTNLYNRHSFDKKISTLKDSSLNGVIVCDIDGLKLMNDAFGHLDGDKLLIRFAEKLNEVITNGFIARIGGDEFGIILQNTSREELEQYADSIVSANDSIGLYDIDFSVSLGYSVVSENQQFVDAFRDAENRMYRMKLKQRTNRKSKALDSILEALDNRSEYHKLHREAVAKYAQGIMQHAGFKREQDQEEIKQAGLLHDIGKVVLDQDLLDTMDPESKDDRKKVQYHAESGYKIISNIIDNDLIGLSVLYHHENYDGSGYPHGIRGTQIPLYSRVIRIADSYDIMTRDDGYNDIMKPKKAVAELRSLKGKYYDPELIDALIAYLKEEGII